MRADERFLKDKLVEALKKEMPTGVAFRHEDVYTAGIPDISYTWKRRTVWIEVKAAGGRTRGLQLDTLKRIGAVGLSALVEYKDSGVRVQTFGVVPDRPENSPISGGSAHYEVAALIKEMINCSR